MKPEFLFIVGVYKSGTSTLQGILNCHPNVLILYEYFNHFPNIKKHDITYNKKMGGVLSPVFNKSKTSKGSKKPDAHNLLIKSRDVFCKNKKYKYFGSKWVGFNSKLTDVWSKHKTIYMIRDIRTWMAKDAINTMFKVRKNKDIFTRYAVEYVVQFIKTFYMQECLRVSMESLVQDTDNIIGKIEAFIKIDLLPYTVNWENKIGKYDDNIKTMVPDWSKHRSSFKTNKKLDVVVKTNEADAAWNIILKIFDKYYNNLDASFGQKEIKSDIEKLKGIKNNKKRHISYKNIYGGAYEC